MKSISGLLIILFIIPFSTKVITSDQNILNNSNLSHLFQDVINPNSNLSQEKLSALLFSAIYQEEEQIVKLLLEKNANPNIAYKGHNPLRVALQKNNAAIIKMLLNAGANPNIVPDTKSFYENTLLAEAINKNNPKIIQILLNAGADSNKQNKKEESPLHIAVKINNPEIIQILLNAGANPNKQNKKEESPLHIAVKINNPEIVQILLNAGANPNIANESGETPLHLATENNNPKIVKMLLDADADKSIKTKTVVWGFDPSLEIALGEYIPPKTALEIAQETPNINPEIIRLLQNSSWFSWL